MISYMMSYHIKDLTVPSPEAVAFQIERVYRILGLPLYTVELTLTLNATECPKQDMCFNIRVRISASSMSMSVRGPSSA